MSVVDPISVDEAIEALAKRFRWPARRSGDLLVGRGEDPVDRVVLCLSGAEVERAVDEHALIVVPNELAVTVRGRAHSRVVAGTSVSHVLLQAAERHQALLVAPDMLGGGHGGFDDRLAARLGIAPARVAAPRVSRDWKLVGFVPESDLDAVRQAVFATGAGVIGEYEKCSFAAPGTGSFRGSEASNPTVGEAGSFETAAEHRLEIVCRSREQVDLAVQAFVNAHSYEEPAYDVYPVRTPTAGIGSGRAGRFAGTLDDFVLAVTELTRSVPDVYAAGVVSQHPSRELSVVVSCGNVADVTDAVLFAPDLQQAVVLCGAADPEARTALRAAGHTVVVSPPERLQRALAGDLDLDHVDADELSDELAESARAATGVDDLWTTGAESALAAASAQDQEAGEMPDTLYFDGGSRGNPGPAAFGYTLLRDGVEVDAASDFIGEATNNVAEYTGLIEGVRRALELGATTLTIHSDSELVVKQVSGEYKVKNAGIKPLHAEAVEVLNRLESWTLTHVRRADNARADELVNHALDEQDVTL